MYGRGGTSRCTKADALGGNDTGMTARRACGARKAKNSAVARLDQEAFRAEYHMSHFFGCVFKHLACWHTLQCSRNMAAIVRFHHH